MNLGFLKYFYIDFCFENEGFTQQCRFIKIWVNLNVLVVSVRVEKERKQKPETKEQKKSRKLGKKWSKIDVG